MSHWPKSIQRHTYLVWLTDQEGKKTSRSICPTYRILGKVIQRHSMPPDQVGGKASRSICPTCRIWEKSSKDICPTDQKGKKTSRSICPTYRIWESHPKTYAPQIRREKNIQINYDVPQLSKGTTPKRASSICRDLICPTCVTLASLLCLESIHPSPQYYSSLIFLCPPNNRII